MTHDERKPSTILAIRTEKGMTQSKLAELSGINARQIRKIETGEIKTRNITVGTITALARALGVGIEELIKENKTMTHQEFEAYVMLMDDDLREQVHAELAPCTDDEFLERYQELHYAKYGEELEV